MYNFLIKFFFIVLLIIYFFPIKIFALKEVREGNRITFFNEKNLKVKSYYIVDNKLRYVYRYYYNINDLIVRVERWFKNQRLAQFIYEYYNNLKLKSKSFFIREYLKYYILYDIKGKMIKKNIYNKVVKK